MGIFSSSTVRSVLRPFSSTRCSGVDHQGGEPDEMNTLPNYSENEVTSIAKRWSCRCLNTRRQRYAHGEPNVELLLLDFATLGDVTGSSMWNEPQVVVSCGVNVFFLFYRSTRFMLSYLDSPSL